MFPLQADTESVASYAKLGKTCVHLILSLLALALPFAILANLDRGIDFSDSGYYHVSIQYLREIDAQTTQFAVVWNLLPLPDNIILHRIALFTLLSASANFLFLSAWKYIWSDSKLATSQLILISALAIGSVSTYYIRWLPDPSYNAIALFLNLMLLGLAFSICSALENDHKVPWVQTVVAGFITAALLITRPPTALTLVVVLTLFVLIFTRPKVGTFIRLATLCLSGMALFLVVSTIVVEPITETIERLRGGLHRRDLLNRAGGGLFSSPMSFLSGLKITILQNWIFGILAVLGMAVLLRGTRSNDERWMNVIAQIGATIGLFGLFHKFAITDNGLVRSNVRIIVGLYWALGLTALASTIIAYVFSWSRQTDKVPIKLMIVCFILILAQFAAVAGTSNNVPKQVAYFGIFSLLALFLVAIRDGRLRLSPVFLAAVCVGFGTQFAAWQHMTNNPYRLAAPLAKQINPIELRGGKSKLKVDNATRDFLQKLTNAVQSAGIKQVRPILIDLSGRLPLVTYHLDFKTMGSPWVLSSYPGSQALFDYTVGRLSDDDLRKAWVLDSPDYKFRFKTTVFDSRGLSFPQDYEKTAIAFSDNLKTKILLFKPKYQIGYSAGE